MVESAAQYQVSTDRLFNYISARLQARHATIPGAAGGAQVQTPRLGGERSQDRTLATLPDSAVPAVSFKINLTPQQVWSIARLSLTGDRINVQIPGPLIPSISQGVITIPLKPRIYTLTVQAGPQWNPGDGPTQFELYDDQEIPVSLTPAAMAAAAPRGMARSPRRRRRMPMSPRSPRRASPSARITRRHDAPRLGDAAPVPVTATIEAAPAMPEPAPDTGSRGNLIVTSQDRLAALELLNEDRVPVMYGDRPCRGNGTLKVDDLPTGVYLVRLRIPEGALRRASSGWRRGRRPRSPCSPPNRRPRDWCEAGDRSGRVRRPSGQPRRAPPSALVRSLPHRSRPCFELRGARRT